MPRFEIRVVSELEHNKGNQDWNYSPTETMIDTMAAANWQAAYHKVQNEVKLGNYPPSAQPVEIEEEDND